VKYSEKGGGGDGARTSNARWKGQSGGEGRGRVPEGPERPIPLEKKTESDDGVTPNISDEDA